jgi:hypothetical protein
MTTADPETDPRKPYWHDLYALAAEQNRHLRERVAELEAEIESLYNQLQYADYGDDL